MARKEPRVAKKENPFLQRLWFLFVAMGFLFYVVIVVLYFQPPGLRPRSFAKARSGGEQLRMEVLSVSSPNDAAAKGAGGEVEKNAARRARLRGTRLDGYGIAGSVQGVVVLGMHRSGTSLVTGLLERMGLNLGPANSLLGPQPGENDKGFFEKLEVIHENDNLMKLQNVNWALNVMGFDHLTALGDLMTNKVDFVEGNLALRFFSDRANWPWAVKDPRLCITLKFWMAMWGQPPAAVIIYRHPVEVAKSLVRRREFGLPRGLHLWIAYNRLAVQNSQGLCRVVANNADLMAHPYNTMLRVYTQLRECGVAVPREASESDVAEFVDPSLRHHNRVVRDADGANLECQNDAWKASRWVSDSAEEGSHEYEREAAAVAHAMRVFCALEDGSAFSPTFEWEALPDYAPP